MQYKKIVCALLMMSAFWIPVQAQRAEVGIDVGGAGYMGDLNHDDPLKISGIAAGAFAKINFDPHWGLGLHYAFGNIKADDLKSKNQDFVNRGLNFSTALHEVALLTEFNFFDIYSPIAKKRVSPFIYAGIGGVLFNPIGTYNNGNKYQLKDYNTEGPVNAYRDYAIVVPFGAGVKYKYTDNLTLFAKIGYRTAFTDYLDDVSGTYPAATVWDVYNDPARKDNSMYLSDPSRSANVGDQRGDFRKRDTYLFVSIGISYTFVSQKCFTF